MLEKNLYFAYGANLSPEVLKKRKIYPLETLEFIDLLCTIPSVVSTSLSSSLLRFSSFSILACKDFINGIIPPRIGRKLVR